LKKLLIISSEFPPGPGGIGNHAYNLQYHLRKEGWKVKTISELRREFGKPLENCSIEYVERKGFEFYFRFAQSINSILKKFIPDIVILSGVKALLFGRILSIANHSRVITIIHGHELEMGGRISRWLSYSMVRHSQIIAVSNFAAERIRRHLNIEVKVIPNGISINKKNLRFKGVNPNNKNLKLITIGTLSKRKGQHNVISAIPLLLNDFPELEYHMVGYPKDKIRLQKLSSDLGIEKHVAFHGVISDDEKFQMMKKMDLFVMLSENLPNGDVEGFGIAVIEANLFGIPAIGSINTGISESVKNKYNGYLIDPKSARGLNEAINSILNNYESFSNNAITWAHRFNWENKIKEYLEVLN